MNEFEFIRRIAEGVPKSGKGLIRGIQDDAAVIEGPSGVPWLITTDIFAEGVHFERGWADWTTLGKKALLVNISDIAAMGGKPTFYLVSLSVPGDLLDQDLADFSAGMNLIASDYNMILIGGDTTSSEKNFTVSVTVVGSGESGQIIYRDGARPGDKIYLTGALGGSAAGLQCLKGGDLGPENQDVIMRHLLPEPRAKLASWLSSNSAATSMIDISDGLKADMNHIADLSGVGYTIDVSLVPIFSGARKLAVNVGIEEFVLTSGEEYEILFTMNAKQEELFLARESEVNPGCSVTKVGEVIADKKIRKFIDRAGHEIKFEGSGFVHEIGGG